MNMYVQPKKRNIKEIRDKNQRFNTKFKEYMQNKRLTTYPEIRESVVNNTVKCIEEKRQTNNNETQTRL